MSTKRAEALEALRQSSSALLEDTMKGVPMKNVHQHIHTALSAILDVIEEEMTTEELPGAPDPEWERLNTQNPDLQEQIKEAGREIFGTPGPITTEEIAAARAGAELGDQDRREDERDYPEIIEGSFDQKDEQTQERILAEEQVFEGQVTNLIKMISYKNYAFSVTGGGLNTPVDNDRFWRIEINRDKEWGDRLYIQVQHYRPDIRTQEWGWGSGGKRYLSRHMTVSEIVRQVFAAILAYEEHECREWLRFDGKAIFGPHINVEYLMGVADDLDVRE